MGRFFVMAWIGAALWGCGPGDTTVLTPPIFPSADSDEFVMPVIRFAGTVVREGSPVAGAVVEVCGFGATVTDAGGEFAVDIARIIDQNVFLAISKPGLATRTYRRFTTNLAQADISGFLLYRLLLRATGTAGRFASGEILQLADGDTVTLALAVRDPAGNRLETTVELPVE